MVVIMRTSIYPAKYENLDAMREFVGQAARDSGMDEDEVYQVILAVDEACSNIIQHAYCETVEGNIEITCNITPEGLKVILRDHGKPFDPSKIPAPNLCPDVKKRPVGGMGLHIMRNLMDEIVFESLGESGNVLTMFKRSRSSV